MNENKKLSPEEEELRQTIIEMSAFEIFHLIAQVSKWTHLGKKERALDIIEMAIRERAHILKEHAKASSSEEIPKLLPFTSEWQ